MDYSELKRITEKEHMNFYDHKGVFYIQNSDGMNIIEFSKSSDDYNYTPYKDLESLPLPQKVIEAIITYINTPIELKNDTDFQINIANRIISKEAQLKNENSIRFVRNWKYNDQIKYFNKLDELLEMQSELNLHSFE